MQLVQGDASPEGVVDRSVALEDRRQRVRVTIVVGPVRQVPGWVATLGVLQIQEGADVTIVDEHLIGDEVPVQESDLAVVRGGAE